MTEMALAGPGRLDVHPQERWPRANQLHMVHKRRSQQSEHPDSQHHIHQAKAITSEKFGMKPLPPNQTRDNETT